MIKYFPESKEFDGKFREQRLKSNIDFKEYKSLLYVGARPQRMDHLWMFENYDVTILEIWEPNIKGINAGKVHHSVKKAIDSLKSLEVVCGNVIDFQLDKKFDIGMWWHGPEHVEEQHLEKAISNLESHCSTVIMGCPWGLYDDHSMSNPYESHISHNQPEFFENLGYYVEAQGKEGAGSNLMSIKSLIGI